MPQNPTILTELNELNSSLSGLEGNMPYQVPAGYFEGLAEWVLRRVKALETSQPGEELQALSTLVAGAPKTNPYVVPPGYFDNNLETVLSLVKTEDADASEELKQLSPFLSGLKKENPFVVPEKYFSEVTVPAAEEEKKARVIGLGSRKWFRYAAAAVVVGVVALAALKLASNGSAISPAEQAGEWVAKSLNHVSTDAIDSFVQLAEESPVVASIDSRTEMKVKTEVNELIKDISDKDIQSFLEDTQESNVDAGDELLN